MEVNNKQIEEKSISVGVGLDTGFHELADKVSINEPTTDSFIDQSAKTHACAFCSKSIPSYDVKRCGKCHKRSYCSRECQSKDWKPKPQGEGQGHKKWCGLACGEEDIDWEVTNIKGKGRGLVAKRFLPAMSRILVDGFGKNSNLLGNPEEACKTLRRISIVNHCCKGNSAKFVCPDEGLKVMLLYAKRDIEAGEEICYNYVFYNETNGFNAGVCGLYTFEDCRKFLKSKFNIDCPPDCFCRDDDMEKLIEDSRKGDSFILPSDSSRQDADLDLKIVQKLLIEHEKMHSTQVDKARLLTIGFRVGIQQEKTMELALERIKMVCQIYSSILHPECEFAKRHENWMKDPSTHPDYLKFEKGDYSEVVSFRLKLLQEDN